MAFGDDLDIIRNKMKTNVDSFKLNEFYKLDKAKALMVITPNQLIITEVRSHNIGLKAISYLLYGGHARCETYSIVVRLDSNGDNKLFIPIFPSGSISSFQAKVFSFFFEQLKSYSDKIGFLNPSCDRNGLYEEVKAAFEDKNIDEAVTLIDERIISYTADEWYKKSKFA